MSTYSEACTNVMDYAARTRRDRQRELDRLLRAQARAAETRFRGKRKNRDR